MSDRLTLPPRLVAQKAESIFSQRRHRFAALLEGAGRPDRLRVDDIEVEVVPTRCELELRRAMADRERGDGATLYLVDWAAPGQLARDLRARVAEGKVYRIGRDERLRQVFNAARFDPRLVASALAQLAFDGEIDEFPKAHRLLLDLPLACFTWLEGVVRGSFSRTSPQEADFVRGCRGGDGRHLAARAASSPLWRRWLDEAGEVLERHLSPFSGVVWRAWLAGEIAAVPAVLWVLEAFVQGDPHDSDRRLLRHVLRQRHPTWAEAAERLALVADGATVSAWDALLRDDPQRPPAGLRELVEAVGTAEVFRASARMAEGLQAREAALAAALDGLIAGLRRGGGGDGPWQAAAAAFAALRAHRAVGPDRRESLDMLQRLAAWLWSGRGDTAGGAAAVELAQRFARDGGYVDWARRVSGRECGDSALGRAARAVRAAVEARRDADEHAFAAGVRAWAASGRPPNGCVPIERASRDLVAAFLRGAPAGAAERRLLVLLIDGMSWARCRELGESLRQTGWEPLRWRPRGCEGGPMLPVLAALPTITAVSRSAFFAGRVPASGELPATGADPARWRDNPAVKDFAGPRGQLELFLKDKVEADRGQPSAEVLDAIADPQRPLVAAVINTIDDALKGTPSLEFSTGAIEIKPLREMLLRAHQAGRAVLLIADHGHVLGERSERIDTGTEAGGARWRLHDEVRPPGRDEVLLEGGAWSPDLAVPVVVLAGERAQYSRHAHHGEHGGLSLAEVVAPALLLGTAELAEASAAADPDLEIAPPDEPAWWRERAPSTAPAAAGPPAVARPQAPSLFGDLGPIDEAAPPPRAGRAVRVPDWVAALRAAPAFKAALNLAPVPPKDREKLAEHALAVCRLLVDGGGRASARAIAQAVDVALGRVGGVMARVASLLNAEGETCVTVDPATDSVALDLERFRIVFGVDLEG